MSRSKRGARRQRHRGKGGGRPAYGTHVVSGPETRIGDVFAVLEEVNEAAHRAVLAGGPYDSPEARLEVAIFFRAVNALKACRVLLGNQYWEHATAIVRQVYELSLNLEWLQSQPDRDAAILRYAKYAVLQRMLAHIATADYNRATGRPVDEERVDTIDRMLRLQFREFIGKEKADGSITWRASWSGNNTRQLADASTNTMRMPQYLVLYRGEWSEQVHGSPVVLLDGLFPDFGEDWMDRTVEADDSQTIQTATMLVSLFVELWFQMTLVPHPDPAVAFGWGERLKDVARSYALRRWERSRASMGDPARANSDGADSDSTATGDGAG